MRKAKTYDAAEYRAKINALMDVAPGYILAVVYGFIKTLLGNEEETA